MRAARPASALASLIGLLLCLSATASATGPGGWDHLGVGATPSLSALNGKVDSLLTVSSTAMYAGGVFTSAGGDPAATMIARWDGAGWHPIGPTAISTATGATVDAIAYDSVTGRLFVGGNFINAGGTAAADFVAYWNGTTWQPPCNISPGGNVTSLQIIGGTLYVGGAFSPPGGLPNGQSLLKCDIATGATTATVTAPIKMNGAIYAMTADAAGNLYTAGTFINMDGTPNSDYVARYDGAAWHAMAPGAVTGITRSITSDGTNVYIGSDGQDIAGIAQADHVAKWNGSAWSALGSNTAGADGFLPASAFINAMVTSGSRLFVTGSFQNANGQATADEIAQFNGSSWAPIGSDGAGNGPLPGPGNALSMLGSKLIAGGNFTTAGGDPLAGYIASNRVFNQPPTSAILDNTVKRMNQLYLLSLATDSDGTIVSWAWNWGDGSPDTVQDGPRGPFASHQYAAPGPYTVTLTVTDNDGAQASSTAAVFVRTGPIPSFTVSPPAPVVGQDVTFTSHSTDPDGAIDTNHWTFTPLTPGPGELPFLTVSSSPTAVRAFTRAGSYRRLPRRLGVPGLPQCDRGVRRSDDHRRGGADPDHHQGRGVQREVPRRPDRDRGHGQSATGHKLQIHAQGPGDDDHRNRALRPGRQARQELRRRPGPAQEGRQEMHARDQGGDPDPQEPAAGRQHRRVHRTDRQEGPDPGRIHRDADGKQRQGQGEADHGQVHDRQVVTTSGGRDRQPHELVESTRSCGMSQTTLRSRGPRINAETCWLSAAPADTSQNNTG